MVYGGGGSNRCLLTCEKCKQQFKRVDIKVIYGPETHESIYGDTRQLPHYLCKGCCK